MLFRVTHDTRYAYDGRVFLEPHTLRLRPRSDGTQRVIRFGMQVEPQPAGQTNFLDVEGNAATQVWFSDLTDFLHVTTTFEVETVRSNPFDFILTDPSATKLPIVYDVENERALAIYRRGPDDSQTVTDFAKSIARETEYQTLSFLAALNIRIYRDWDCIVRTEGAPQPPGLTLEQKRGSCRDLAVFFMAACRVQGIAARFVSGYQEGAPEQQQRYLHAWAEVYLPGAGWRGYDPTHGLVVADRHVSIAASHTPLLAAPITGSFRGSGVTGRMQAAIVIETFENLDPA